MDGLTDFPPTGSYGKAIEKLMDNSASYPRAFQQLSNTKILPPTVSRLQTISFLFLRFQRLAMLA